MARRLWVMTVKPLAKSKSIQGRSAGDWIVSVRAPARDGKANDRLVELLVDHFHKTKARVRILHGHGSRRKLIEVD